MPIYDLTFDLDGVLADTRFAVERAYEHAGVELPPDAWGKPVGSWCTADQHRLKQQIYPQYLEKYARPLQGVKALEHLRREQHLKIAIVTNASWRSAIDVISWLRVEADGLLCGDKIVDLALLRPTCHVDDEEVLTGTPVVPFIDDAAALVNEVKRWL